MLTVSYVTDKQLRQEKDVTVSSNKSRDSGRTCLFLLRERGETRGRSFGINEIFYSRFLRPGVLITNRRGKRETCRRITRTSVSFLRRYYVSLL